MLKKEVSVKKEDGQWIFTIKLTNVCMAKVSGYVIFPGCYEKSGSFRLKPGESETLVTKSPADTATPPEVIITDPISQC